MEKISQPNTRRGFIERVSHFGVVAAISGCASNAPGSTVSPSPTTSTTAGWDLSWVKRVARASDRAVFDMPNIGNTIMLDMATRFLDNCDTIYGKGKHSACAVLNVRTRAIALALNDDLWTRYALGVEYDVKDPKTKEIVTKNPFRTAPADAYPGTGTIDDLLRRGSIILVCDFALGHLANRLATKAGRPADQVHADLLAGFIQGAIAVPSGMYGLAKAQNAGCGLVVI